MIPFQNSEFQKHGMCLDDVFGRCACKQTINQTNNEQQEKQNQTPRNPICTVLNTNYTVRAHTQSWGHQWD